MRRGFFFASVGVQRISEINELETQFFEKTGRFFPTYVWEQNDL